MSDNKSDTLIKKILRMYKNYGLDISDMSEEEFIRVRREYEKKCSIDKDLKESEKFADKFTEDII